MLALQTYIGGIRLSPVLTALALFLGTVALGLITKWILNSLGRRLIAKTKSDLDNIILEILVDRIKWIAVVAGAYLGTEELALTAGVTNATARQWLGYGQGVIFVCFVIVIAALLIRMADSSVKYTMERHARRSSQKLNEALLPLLNRVTNILIALIALIIILHHFGQDVSSLVVSLGVGSLAIALAAQETIANMIGGFVIMTDRPFRVGDRIQLPSGEIGDVHEIGIRSTKILDFDNNLIVSPNAELIKGKIINFSYPAEQIRVVVDVRIAYGADLERAKSIMTRFAMEHPDVLKEPVPAAFLIGFGESSLNLTLSARTHDYHVKFLVETTLREQIYNAFLKEGIEIPFPQRVVHLSNTSNAPRQNP
jgi:MscS family membrane protein